MSKKQTPQRISTPRREFQWFTDPPGWLAPILIVVVGALAYSNTFNSTFHFDDETSIVNNPAIRDLGNLKAIFGYSATRFITYLTFALNYRLGGLDVLGYHVFNLVVHIMASVMVWILVRQLSQTPALKDTAFQKSYKFVSLFAALLFVAHPVQTQGVTYIAQRAASLASMFYLLALAFYGKARLLQLARGSSMRAALYFGVAFVSGLLGLFTKETVLTLPFALLMYELFFVGKIRGKSWVFLGFITAFFATVPAILVLKGIIELNVGGAVPWQQYLLTQPRVWMTYVRLIFFPVAQNLDYDHPLSDSIFELAVIGSLAAIVALVYIAYRLFHRHRLVSFGIAWFVLTLLPESSILPLPDIIYEHRLYLPMVGVSLAIASIVHALTRTWPRGTVFLLTGLLIASLTVLSFERNSVWKDDLSLWEDTVSKSPKKARPYNNRGKAYLERAMYENALYDFNRALVLNPSYGDAYSNRGAVFLFKGDNARAISDFQKALQFGVSYVTNYARLIYNLGLAHSNKGDERKAVEYYTEAIRANSEAPTTYYNRAISYERLGEYGSSISDYGRAIALRPSYAKAFNNRGVVLGKLGMLDSALADYDQAVKLDPMFLAPYLNRARIHLDRSENERALDDLTGALKIAQNSPEVYVLRGRVLMKMSAFERALSDFDAAVRLDAWRGEAYYWRGLSLESLGRRQAANEDFKRARALGFKGAN